MSLHTLKDKMKEKGGQAVIAALITAGTAVAIASLSGVIVLASKVSASNQAGLDRDRRISVVENQYKDLNDKLDALLFANPQATQRYRILKSNE